MVGSHVQPDPEHDELLVIPRTVLETIEAQTQVEKDKNHNIRLIAKILGSVATILMVSLFSLYGWSEYKETIDQEDTESYRSELDKTLTDTNNKLENAERSLDLLEEVLGNNPILITQEQINGFAVMVDCNGRSALQELINGLSSIDPDIGSITVTDNCPPAQTDQLP